MAVKIAGVRKSSVCGKKGILPGDTLLSVNGSEINDVLDYRFYTGVEKIRIEYVNGAGKRKTCRVRNDGDIDNIGLEFETYLMDGQRSCKNKCVFCFIDQLPKGMRKSLYFKDDDSRLSFLFGNYITLTNLSEHDAQRIIDYHISPVNVSVHTMDPELRVKMMKNPNAGTSLTLLERFSEAGIAINAQLVLCPGVNDGEALSYSLAKLAAIKTVASIAAVPVGLTKHREGLPALSLFDAKSAAEVIDTIDHFNDTLIKAGRGKLAYPSDEFYLTAGRPVPGCDYYDDFPQLDNGVGMLALTESEFMAALENAEEDCIPRRIAAATGEAAYPLIKKLAERFTEKHTGTSIDVFCVKNRFFGESVTVAGLITGGDLLSSLKEKVGPGTVLVLPSVMFRGRDDLVFLDDVTAGDVETALGVKISVSGSGGDGLFDAFYDVR